MRQRTILIMGTFEPNDRGHELTRDALHHAARAAGVVVNTRWMGPEDLALYPGLLEETAAVVLAPPAEQAGRTLSSAYQDGLRAVRERGLPFLATGASHALVFVEVARNVCGLAGAGGVCFAADTRHPVIRPITRHGTSTPETPELRTVTLSLTAQPLIEELYGGAREVEERTNVAYGLNPDYAHTIEEAGLRPAAVDVHGGRPYLHVLEGVPFHVTAAFLPQLGSRSGAPHPLFEGLLGAALSAGA